MSGTAAVQQKQTFTASDMARFCDVDQKTIHNWCEKGKLPHYRTPGRHLRFKRAEVIAFLKEWNFTVPAELQEVVQEAAA